MLGVAIAVPGPAGGVMALGAAQLQVVGVTRRAIERETLPAWLSLPPRVEVELPDAVKIDLVESTVVSNETPRLAALVGLIRNVGRPLRGAHLRLTLVSADGAPIAAIDNTAAPSAAAAGGLLPFRFPLEPTGDRVASALRISIDEDAAARRRTLDARIEPGYRVRASGRQGVTVTGTIAPLAPPPPASSRLTLVLRDKDGRILDVLTGPLTIEPDRRLGFALDGQFPIARRVRTLTAWVECDDSSML